MLERLTRHRSGRIVVGVVVVLGLCAAGGALAGGVSGPAGTGGDEGLWRAAGNFLYATGGAILAIMAMRGHITDKAIHRTAEDLDAVYLRKDGAVDELAPKFPTLVHCDLQHKHTCELLGRMHESMERMEGKIDKISES